MVPISKYGFSFLVGGFYGKTKSHYSTVAGLIVDSLSMAGSSEKRTLALAVMEVDSDLMFPKVFDSMGDLLVGSEPPKYKIVGKLMKEIALFPA
jgi:hypothetical protein